MALNVRLEFRDTAIPDLTEGTTIIRVELVQEISEAFSLSLRLRSKATQIDMSTVVGQIARVRFYRDEGASEPEPHLPVVEGLVRRGRQLVAAGQDGKSTYELIIVHQLWLLTRHKVPGIARQISAAEDFKWQVERRNKISAIKVPIPVVPAQPTRVREYFAHYDETSYDAHRRTLAEDGVSFYFTGEGLTTPTLVADTNVTRSSVQPTLPFTPSADALRGKTDAVTEIEFGNQLESTGKRLRDYHFDNPRFFPTGQVAAGSEAAGSWGDYTYEEGSLHALDDSEKEVLLDRTKCDEIAQRRLEELLRSKWTAECRTTCPMPAGAVLTVTGDHPIANLPLTVVRVVTLLEYPDDAQGTVSRQVHRVSCVKASDPYRPRILPKQRIHGIQRATVVGPEHIHVDEHGRVLLAFFWDTEAPRHPNPENVTQTLTRRVPVAQGWAGPNHGMLTVPRCGDEVLVAYIDGDPDQPIVVGRLYNGLNRAAVKLPDDKTQSLWRTQSSPSKDGFHEIRFEDRSGEEELHIEAQRRHTRLVKGSESVNVHGTRDITVGWDEIEVIHNDHSRTVHANEAVVVDGTRDLTVTGDNTHTVHSNESIVVDANQSIKVDADQTIRVGGTRDVTVGGNQMDHFQADWLSDTAGTISRNATHHGTMVSGQANVACGVRSELSSVTHNVETPVFFLTAHGLAHMHAGVFSVTASIITLMAGASSITLGPGGVSINGPVVKINC